MRLIVKNEDWMSLWIGLLLFLLSAGLLIGADILGWAAKMNVWTSVDQAIVPVSPRYSALGSVPSLVLTFLFLLGLMSLAAWLLRTDVRRFAAGFTAIFAVSFICWFVGHYGHLAATPDQLERDGEDGPRGLPGRKLG